MSDANWLPLGPTDPGPHDDIASATVRTTALVGSVFGSPPEQREVNSRVQPCLVAGLGIRVPPKRY